MEKAGKQRPRLRGRNVKIPLGFLYCSLGGMEIFFIKKKSGNYIKIPVSVTLGQEIAFFFFLKSFLM